ncbi:MAG: hypothetical protein HDT27_06525 [Subdoligranulum sp.]|nr:hypothetical protein [Subdoligranulum sp.]
MTYDIVILAKSRKYKNYCVAGVDIHSGQWIRPVSLDESIHFAVTEEDMLCTDGTYAQVLDVVRVAFTGPAQAAYQLENMVIDQSVRWQKLGHWNIRQVLQVHHTDMPRYIYGNTERALTEEEIDEAHASLLLVCADWLRVQAIFDEDGKRKIRANFLYRKNWYNDISVTDFAFDDLSEEKPDRVMKPAWLVISLPDVPYEKDGLFYKFIAQVFTGDAANGGAV